VTLRYAVVGAGNGGTAMAAELSLLGRDLVLVEMPGFENRLKVLREAGGIVVESRIDHFPGGVGTRLAPADADKARHDGFKWRKKMDQIGEETCRPDTQDLFSQFQARADRIYGYHGQQADKPLYGETLNAYRRRLLVPFQQFSPAFKHADLRVLAVDPAGFNHAEKTILADAEAEGRNPMRVPPGTLREHVETRGGHQYTKFFGRPIAWMGPMMIQGKRVKRIIERSDSGNSRTLYERA
jgi:hypothetical protein